MLDALDSLSTAQQRAISALGQRQKEYLARLRREVDEVISAANVQESPSRESSPREPVRGFEWEEMESLSVPWHSSSLLYGEGDETCSGDSALAEGAVHSPVCDYGEEEEEDTSRDSVAILGVLGGHIDQSHDSNSSLYDEHHIYVRVVEGMDLE